MAWSRSTVSVHHVGPDMTNRKRRLKSSIDRLPAEQREYVEALLRRRDLTLDEMVFDLQTRWPGEPAADITRSSLNRYDLRIEEAGREIREIEAAAGALVGELGEGFGEKSADFLTQAITVVAVKAAMRAKDDPDLGTKEAKDLALMAKNALDAKRMNIAQRQAIQQEAREKALRDAAARVDSAAQARGLNAEDARFWREQVLKGM